MIYQAQENTVFRSPNSLKPALLLFPYKCRCLPLDRMIIEFFGPVARNCTQPFASLFSSTFQNLRTHTTLTGHIAIRQTASATMKPHPLVLLFSALASKHVLRYRRQHRDEKRCSRPYSFRPNTLQNKRSEKNLGLPSTWKNPPSINQPKA